MHIFTYDITTLLFHHAFSKNKLQTFHDVYGIIELQKGVYMFAKIVVDIEHSKVDRIFSYSIPKDINISVGSRVLVPFGRGNKTVEGYVLGFSDTISIDASLIKPIYRALMPKPEFTPVQLALAEWMKRYYMTPLVTALRLMFPAEMRGERVKPITKRYAKLILNPLAYEEAQSTLRSKDGKIKAPVMYGLLELLQDGEKSVKNLSEKFSSASSALHSMVSKGWVTLEDREVQRNPYQHITAHGQVPKALSSAQQHAINQITCADNETFLIHGVTGSGKTEVYIRSIADCVDAGKTAIMLVPEIALTPQLVAMFHSRLGDCAAVYHSGLSSGERYDQWRRINSGEAKVVIGPRSALFVPLKNVGLIILDEEHENSYKADQHPKYKTHEVAKKRAELEGSTLVFASATPSVETYYAAETGKITLLNMPERVLNVEMPKVYVSDMREELRNGNRTIFSGRLYEEMVKTLDQHKQMILFINRRGVASFVMCRGCGYIVRCTDCDVSMTLHQNNDGGELICHYCGRHQPFDKTCPKCGKPYVKAFGAGTQQIEHQVNFHFPQAKTIRMDFDTTRTRDAHTRIYQAFKNHEADILIGTQLVAKGLDFENVRLVGAMAADVSLHFPDYLAVEKSYALLEQAGGRAGRKGDGVVVIQTYHPDHYAIQYAANHDYHGFYREELSRRRAVAHPPFGIIYRILFVGKKEDATKAAAECVTSGLKQALTLFNEYILMLTCSPAPIKKIMSKPRYQIIIKAKVVDRAEQFNQTLYACVEQYKFDDVNFGIEINPQSMV